LTRMGGHLWHRYFQNESDVIIWIVLILK